MTHTPISPSALPLSHRRILANELFIEIKEGRWRRHRATRTSTPGKPPPHTTHGAHQNQDSDLVRQRLEEVIADHQYIQFLAPPIARFEFPPMALHLNREVYEIALEDLEGDYLFESWRGLLRSSVMQPFYVSANRHGTPIMRRNVVRPGVTQQAAEAAVMILNYCTIAVVEADAYEEYVEAVARGVDYALALANIEQATA